MFKRLKNRIESKRDSKNLIWISLVFSKDVIWLLISDPFLILNLPLLIIRAFYYKLKGDKMIVYDLSDDYFFYTFEPIYEEFKKNKKIKIFFSHPSEYKDLKKYLLKYVKKYFIISKSLSSILPFDMVISSERGYPYNPFFYNPKIILMDHGLGVTQQGREEWIKRCHIHFSNGPRDSNSIRKMYSKTNRKYKLYEIGYPKSDKLWNQRNLKFRGFKKIKTILYFPHWTPGSSINIFKEEIIKTLAETKLKIIVKPHNFLYRKFEDQNWEKRFKALSEKYDNVIYSKEVDVQKLFSFADVLITDTRSTSGLEYSFLLKPLILFKNLKKETYLFEKELLDIAFNFSTLNQLSNILNKFKNPDKNFINKIKNQRKKQEKLILKNVPNLGKATKKAIEIIEKELGLYKCKKNN